MVQSSRQAEAGRAGHRGVWEAGQLLLAARGFPRGVVLDSFPQATRASRQSSPPATLLTSHQRSLHLKAKLKTGNHQPATGPACSRNL